MRKVILHIICPVKGIFTCWSIYIFSNVIRHELVIRRIEDHTNYRLCSFNSSHFYTNYNLNYMKDLFCFQTRKLLINTTAVHITSEVHPVIWRLTTLNIHLQESFCSCKQGQIFRQKCLPRWLATQTWKLHVHRPEPHFCGIMSNRLPKHQAQSFNLHYKSSRKFS